MTTGAPSVVTTFSRPSGVRSVNAAPLSALRLIHAPRPSIFQRIWSISRIERARRLSGRAPNVFVMDEVLVDVRRRERSRAVHPRRPGAQHADEMVVALGLVLVHHLLQMAGERGNDQPDRGVGARLTRDEMRGEIERGPSLAECRRVGPELLERVAQRGPLLQQHLRSRSSNSSSARSCCRRDLAGRRSTRSPGRRTTRRHEPRPGNRAARASRSVGSITRQKWSRF